MSQQPQYPPPGQPWQPYQPDPAAYPLAPAPAPKAPKRPWYRRGWFVAPVSLITGIIIGSATAGAGGGGTTAAAPTATAAVAKAPSAAKPAATKAAAIPAKPAVPAAITDDGTYVVGTDIAPGTYRSPGGDLCYWARLKDTNGDLGSIIANNVGSGRQVVTISKTDKAFETRGCGTWTK